MCIFFFIIHAFRICLAIADYYPWARSHRVWEIKDIEDEPKTIKHTNKFNVASSLFGALTAAFHQGQTGRECIFIFGVLRE